MRAIECARYGPPEVLRLREVELPVPRDNEVRIRICAAIVTPSDCAFRKAEPFIIRLIYGLTKPRNSRTGVEFAGEIDAVGRTATGFKVGDRVYGMSPHRFGAHAEYVCLPAEAVIAPMPANASYEDAACLSDGPPTALTFLRDTAGIRSGRKVLVNGASGAVGAAAVQLAKHYGAEVTGVCSAANAELVRSLGADRVVDYARTDFTAEGRSYDIIFDAVGKSSFLRCRKALTPRGVYLSTVPSLGLMLSLLTTAAGRGRKAKFTAAGLKQNAENFRFLGSLFAAGRLRSVIDRRYTLAQIADAHRYVDTGRKKGSVVIDCGTDPAAGL